MSHRSNAVISAIDEDHVARGAGSSRRPTARVAVAIGATIEIHFLNGNQPPQRVTSVSGSTTLVIWIERGLLVQEGSEALAMLRVLLIDPQTRARSLWKELLPRDTGGIMNVGALVVTPDGRSYAYRWARALSGLYLGSLLA